MKRILFSKGSVWIGAALAIASCGKIKEVANQISNEVNLPGRWLVTQSDHSGKIAQFLEHESMVLSFVDGKMAFAPADTVKGQTVYAALSDCTKGPRPYTMDKTQVVFPAMGACAERRITVEMLNETTLKFPDPDDNNVTRVMVRIDDARYNAIVKAADRKL